MYMNKNNAYKAVHESNTREYLAPGFTEWIALIPIGKARIRIPFTGGSVSGYGTVPAKFTTSSAALAKLIENSRQFRTGKIIKSR